MTAGQIRRRRNARTILWSVLGALAISALILLLSDLPASASHWECWNPGNCYQPVHPPPPTRPTVPIGTTRPNTTRPNTTRPPTTADRLSYTTRPRPIRPPTTRPPPTTTTTLRECDEGQFQGSCQWDPGDFDGHILPFDPPDPGTTLIFSTGPGEESDCDTDDLGSDTECEYEDIETSVQCHPSEPDCGDLTDLEWYTIWAFIPVPPGQGTNPDAEDTITEDTEDPVCSGGQTWNGTACVCPGVQTWNGTQCVIPPVDPVCSGGQTWNGTACVCPTGQTWTGTACVTPIVHTCSGGQTWNGTACVCPTGQTWTGTACVTPIVDPIVDPPDCSGGQTWDDTALACVCPRGQTWTGTACVTPIVHTCSGGQTWNGTACVCPTGQTWTGTACVTPIVHTCSGGQTWDDTALACVCPRGQTWTGTACVTPIDPDPDDPTTCDDDEYFDGLDCQDRDGEVVDDPDADACLSDTHSHGGGPCVPDHPDPACHPTLSVSYTSHNAAGVDQVSYLHPCPIPQNTPSTPPVTGNPPICSADEHSHPGTGCHSDHIAPTCHASNLRRYQTHVGQDIHDWAYIPPCPPPPPTTTTTVYNPCTAGQHYHGDTNRCHSNHTVATCHNNFGRSYTVHDPNAPNDHLTMVVMPCGQNTPKPPTPQSCPAGQHYHALTDSCHGDYPAPICDRTNYGWYYEHSSSNPDDHELVLVLPCPLGPPTTTTTTTTTTTAPPTTSGVLTCGPIPSAEISRIASAYGWDSPFDYSSTVQAGTALPQGGGTGSLFVTSDKANSSGAAEPDIWPVFPSSPSLVTDGGGCIWESMDIRSVWRELHIWNAADRLLMGSVVPSFVTRWNNLSTVQQDILRNGHPHVSQTPRICPMSTLDPENDCSFYLPFPTVYAWQLQVRFETDDGETTGDSWETLHSGTSYLVRLIDYADWQSTISG